MSIDQKIKSALQSEEKQLDQILAYDEGIFTMLRNAYKGALGGWVIFVTIITLFVSAIMIWAAYEFFFVASIIEQKLHWGVILLVALIIQVALKMWTFMEMNRMSMLRELKRIEVAMNTSNTKIK